MLFTQLPKLSVFRQSVHFPIWHNGYHFLLSYRQHAGPHSFMALAWLLHTFSLEPLLNCSLAAVRDFAVMQQKDFKEAFVVYYSWVREHCQNTVACI